MIAPDSSTLKGNLKSLVATGGVLAGAGTAGQAAIVYTDLTSSPLQVSAPGGTIYFSLTGQAADTTGAVTEQFYLLFGGGSSVLPVVGGAESGAGVMRYAASFTPRLSGGATISGGFNYSYGILAANTAGQWDPGDQGFLGLRFDNSGTINYGWADVSYNVDESLTLYGFAYEDSGAPIVTPVPEPATTGAIAAVLAGSVAAFEARRRRKAARQVTAQP